MEVIQRKIEELIPYERNQKKHDEKQIQNVANSIKRFGWQQPIVVDKKDVVVIGHCRLLAAKKLGLEQVPVVVADKLSEDEIRELRIADNKTNESPWDFGLLNADIGELDFDGFDFDFSIPNFEDGSEPVIDTHEAKDDEYLEEKIESKAKLGDIYQLGEHRLMCGDSTNASNVELLMNGEKAKMLFTSPPYSDMREYEGGKDLNVDKLSEFIKAFRPYTDYQCVNLGIQRKNNDIYEYWNDYIRKAREVGYKMLAWNVWDKELTGNIGMAKAFFPIRHEFVFVFGTDFFEINLTIPKKEDSINSNKKRTKRNSDGSTSVHSIGDTSKAYKQMESVQLIHPVLDNNLRILHSAAFPVELPAAYIKSMSNEGDIIIEPFGGSGTTLIACEQTERRCRIMELEPKYVDVIINRWEKLTGGKAVLIQNVK